MTRKLLAFLILTTLIPLTPATAVPAPIDRTHAVKIDMIGRNGKAAISPSETVIADLEDPEAWYFARPGETLQLPAGRYAAIAAVYSVFPGQFRPAMTSVAEPTFQVDAARTLTLDARPGQRVKLEVEQPDAQILEQRAGLRISHNGSHFSLTAGGNSELYAVPTAGTHPHLDSYLRVQLEKPQASLTATAPERLRVPVEWVLEEPRLAGRHELEVVDVGHALPAEIKAKDLRGKLAVFTLSPAEADRYGVRVQALADAGARAAALYLTAMLKISARDGKAIPVLLSLGNEGSGLARATRAVVEGIAASPYHYELAFAHSGGIAPGMTYRPANRELARVQAGYYSLGAERVGYANIGARQNDLEMFDFPSRILTGTRQTRYFSPQSITWSRVLRTGYQAFRPADSTYARGRADEHWGKAVLAPSLLGLDRDGLPLASREGDAITVQLPLRSDSDGNLGFVGEDDSSSGDTGDTELFADGRLVSRSGEPGRGTFKVPATASTLRLTSEVTRTLPQWPLSSKVTAEWTFHASRTGVLPLLTIGFDPAVDLQNSAPAGGPFTFPVTVHRQPGSTGGPATLRSVEISYDDGVTWKRAKLHRTPTGWTATVSHPSGALFASLRATAHDAHGNNFTTTITHAYHLR